MKNKAKQNRTEQTNKTKQNKRKQNKTKNIFYLPVGRPLVETFRVGKTFKKGIVKDDKKFESAVIETISYNIIQNINIGKRENRI
jgi:hypothetical protein